jgi:hypothetical protein
MERAKNTDKSRLEGRRRLSLKRRLSRSLARAWMKNRAAKYAEARLVLGDAAAPYDLYSNA